MTSIGVLNVVVFFLVILAVTKPIGVFMSKLFEGERTFLHPLLRPLEKLTYRLCGIREDSEQRWTQYAASLIAFSLMSFLFAYLIQRLQRFLPLNPMHFGSGKAPASATAMTPDLAFNTAVSFVTNTNWQNYGGETTLSYFVQMAALTVQNFVSAAAGVAAVVALIRGFARKQANSIGNFWVDLVRCTLYLFLPLSLLGALFLCSQGVIQNLKSYTTVKTVEGATQTIAQGPVASQEAIKMVGTNGGGFFNANSAHPFENPTPLTNFVEMLMIFVIPAGLTYQFGRMVGDRRQGWALFAAMSVLFLAGVFICYPAEQRGNPQLTKLGLETHASSMQPGGNMEGKEVRFGIPSSALFATVTTDASCGAINSWHDSFTPLGGMIPLLNIMLGEIIYGGVGSGLYGMLVMVVLTVFIAGLMVGRTPEYLGKKIEAREVKLAMLYVLIFALSILVLSAWGSIASYGTARLGNSGPHGLSEIVYAFVSTTGNNGSAFGGLSGNTPWYNTVLGINMLVGRFLMIIPMMAIAGNLATKKSVPPSAGTFPVHTPLFVGLLIGVILIVGALTFFPVLSLGPIVEHFLMKSGTLF